MKNKSKSKDKLIHDINTGLFSIQQGIDLIAENIGQDRQIVDKLIPLSLKKVEELLTDWEVLKSKIK